MKETESIALKVVQLRRSQIFPERGTPKFICIPNFDKAEKIKSRRRVNYVLKFRIKGWLPSREAETIYIHPDLTMVPPSAVDIEQARRQAYAVCKRKFW